MSTWTPDDEDIGMSTWTLDDEDIGTDNDFELLAEYQTMANIEDAEEESRRKRWMEIVECGNTGHVWGESHCLNCGITQRRWFKWEEESSYHDLDYNPSDGFSYCKNCDFLMIEGMDID